MYVYTNRLPRKNVCGRRSSRTSATAPSELLAKRRCARVVPFLVRRLRQAPLRRRARSPGRRAMHPRRGCACARRAGCGWARCRQRRRLQMWRVR